MWIAKKTIKQGCELELEFELEKLSYFFELEVELEKIILLNSKKLFEFIKMKFKG